MAAGALIKAGTATAAANKAAKAGMSPLGIEGIAGAVAGSALGGIGGFSKWALGGPNEGFFENVLGGMAIGAGGGAALGAGGGMMLRSNALGKARGMAKLNAAGAKGSGTTDFMRGMFTEGLNSKMPFGGKFSVLNSNSAFNEMRSTISGFNRSQLDQLMSRIKF